MEKEEKKEQEIEKKKEETENKEYSLVQVPTEHTIAVQTPEGKIISTEMAIVEILNIVKDIQENIG